MKNLDNKPYSLSIEARQDVYEILAYTAQKFGLAQSEKYGNELHMLLIKLAENPFIGRGVPEYGEGYRQFPYKSHIVFYRPVKTSIFIVRILGSRMNISGQFG
jgi:toxin ParE1/3/4